MGQKINPIGLRLGINRTWDSRWFADNALMKRTFRASAQIAGLIQRNQPSGPRKSGRQATFSSDILYDTLQKYDPGHLLLSITREEAMRGLVDFGRVEEMLRRTAGRIDHMRLDRVTPLAAPLFLEQGKLPVEGAAQERLLAEETDRKVHLEIEPGTFLLANAGAIIARVQDVVSTGGEDGMHFLKLDSGMTEILRPSLYAAQHPIHIVSAEDRAPSPELRDYLVVGHCCESGDILTTGADDPEALQPRSLPVTEIGDLCVIDGAGAYCAAMTAKNYNSFPEAAEVLLPVDGAPRLIRRRQSLEQILENEC